MWEIEATDEVTTWLMTLPRESRDAIARGLEVLARHGPTLGRPLVDRLVAARHHNLKELRVSAGRRRLRVLFAFDPRGVAVLLLGGDKTGNWTGWYRRSIPLADDRFDAHLERLGEGTPS